MQEVILYISDNGKTDGKFRFKDSENTRFQREACFINSYKYCFGLGETMNKI